MRSRWTVLITVVCTTLLLLLGLGAARLWFDMSVQGKQVVQRSCGSGELAEYCVQRTRLPGIPLLRAERTRVEVHAADNLGRMLSLPDPFISTVVIDWGTDRVTLTDDTGYALVLDRSFLDRLRS